jgi:hypothetical protein
VVDIAPPVSEPETAPAPAPTPETPHLNPLPQGERKEELAAVSFAVAPETAPAPASSPSATEQPNNLTTAPQAPSEVAAGSWEIMKDKV